MGRWLSLPMFLAWTASGLIVPPTITTTLPDDYVVVTTQPSLAPLNATTWSGKYPSTGRSYTAHVGIATNLRAISVELPPSGCTVHAPVSASASHFGCKLAVNAGFFNFPPNASCDGDLIVNSSTVLWASNNSATFALTQNDSIAIGYMSPAAALSLNLRSAVSGKGWLVRNGASNVNRSRDLDPRSSFVTEKAPRTAVGVRADGAVLLLVIDGIESTKVGPDLFEMAEASSACVVNSGIHA